MKPDLTADRVAMPTGVHNAKTPGHPRPGGWVLEEYADYLPLTCAPDLLPAVGAYGYEKTERAYARLGEYLVAPAARR